MQHILKHYPKAETLSSLEELVLQQLSDENLDSSDCIWGTSICSDEVNNSFNKLGTNFAGPGPFRFGGISGIPFTGKTGFKAFSSHIPDQGGAVIIYGPHIGISNNGELGTLHREGQENHSTCCGSLIAGLENVKAGKVLMISHDDYQQGQVNKILIENYEDIKKSDQPIKKTTDVAYNQIKRELTDIISACLENLSTTPVLAIGGIVINTDPDKEDYFEVRDVAWFNK